MNEIIVVRVRACYEKPSLAIAWECSSFAQEIP